MHTYASEKIKKTYNMRISMVNVLSEQLILLSLLKNTKILPRSIRDIIEVIMLNNTLLVMNIYIPHLLNLNPLIRFE